MATLRGRLVKAAEKLKRACSVLEAVDEVVAALPAGVGDFPVSDAVDSVSDLASKALKAAKVAKRAVDKTAASAKAAAEKEAADKAAATTAAVAAQTAAAAAEEEATEKAEAEAAEVAAQTAAAAAAAAAAAKEAAAAAAQRAATAAAQKAAATKAAVEAAKAAKAAAVVAAALDSCDHTRPRGGAGGITSSGQGSGSSSGTMGSHGHATVVVKADEPDISEDEDEAEGDGIPPNREAGSAGVGADQERHGEQEKEGHQTIPGAGEIHEEEEEEELEERDPEDGDDESEEEDDNTEDSDYKEEEEEVEEEEAQLKAGKRKLQNNGKPPRRKSARAAGSPRPSYTESPPREPSKRERRASMLATGAGSGSGAAAAAPRKAKSDDKEKDNTKIYLRGLPWDTSDDDVKEFFKACGKIVSVEQPKNPDGRSSGTAYVVFDSGAAAAKAVEMDGQELGGRWLKIMMSSERPNHAPKVKPEGCTTVFIGNLAWSIDEDTVWQTFGECGDIKSVRFAEDKETGEFRGFGHVEFYDCAHVDAAMALANSDVLGRPIRVDYVDPRASRDESFGVGC